MTLRPALERFAKGLRWYGEVIAEWAWERPQAALARQTLLQWRSQRRRTREVMAEADTAIKAARLDTIDGDVQLAAQLPAFNDEIERLLLIPKRSRRQELLLASLRRKVREIDEIVATRGATPETVGHLRMRRFLPALPAVAGFALRPWMLWAGALLLALTWGLYSDIRAGRAELARDEAESLARANFERAEQWQERANEYRQAVIDAANVARHAAEALDAERAAQARAAARERRRNREIQDVLTGSPEPPAWRLRDDGAEDRDSGTPTG